MAIRPSELIAPPSASALDVAAVAFAEFLLRVERAIERGPSTSIAPPPACAMPPDESAVAALSES